MAVNKIITPADVYKHLSMPIVVNQSAGAHNDKKKQQNKNACRNSKSKTFQNILKDNM